MQTDIASIATAVTSIVGLIIGKEYWADRKHKREFDIAIKDKELAEKDKTILTLLKRNKELESKKKKLEKIVGK